MSAKVRISENNTKTKELFFVLYCRARVSSTKSEVRISENKTKGKPVFLLFYRAVVTSMNNVIQCHFLAIIQYGVNIARNLTFRILLIYRYLQKSYKKGIKKIAKKDTT